MRTHHFFSVFFALLACVVQAQAPVPVAERVVTHRDKTTRVTLFSNRTVVVTIREDNEQGFVRRTTLGTDSFMVYLNALQTDAEALGEAPVSSQVDTSHSEVILTLHVGPDAPRLLRFSPMAVVSLPLARIMGALDDLETQVLEASPSAEELRTWAPRKGDRVQLFNSSFAVVVEVGEDGTLVLEHEETFIREIVPTGSRDQVILHVVERDR